jgi:nitrate reductase delta subunit
LLVYPASGGTADLDSLVAQAAGCDAEAGRALEAFDGWARGQSTEAMQEAFTQTFDLNPVCALEVGWQLFGEEYERGAFMVHMRQLLRDHAVPEGGELPDHLASLLAVLPRLGTEEARGFASDALFPAVGKMLAAIEQSGSPFRPVIQAISRLLAAFVAAPEVAHA